MGLFDRLRGNDGPRVAFLGIDGVREVAGKYPRKEERGNGGWWDVFVAPDLRVNTKALREHEADALLTELED